MPVPNLPPTPAASLDITGKTSSGQAPSITLGPAAVDRSSDRSISATPSINGSDSSYHPASPVSPNTGKRKQPVAASQKATSDDFNLPPPPSRSRKIIQMKPKPDAARGPDAAAGAPEPQTTAKGGRKRASASGNTAAGRKIARKTAHSLIERRRRSKMNEEFGVLKDMIPACQGQEMHKLAILQASIDYLRYLESCVTDLKAGSSQRPTPYPTRALDPEDDSAMQDPDADEDEDMSEDPPSSVAPSAATTRPPTSHSHARSSNTLPPLSQITTSASNTSPSFTPIDSASRSTAGRHFSISSSTASFSPYIHPLPPNAGGGPGSKTTSPIFSPQSKAQIGATAGGVERFSLTSPALEPIDRRIGQGKSERSDREAMAALLMLNQNTDRRGAAQSPVVTGWRDTGERKRGAAMSVKDLLSP